MEHLPPHFGEPGYATRLVRRRSRCQTRHELCGAARDDERTVHVEVGTTVDEAERQLILKTLQSTHNNKTRAAEILGITTKTLQNKLKEYASAAGGSQIDVTCRCGGVDHAAANEARADGERADFRDRAGAVDRVSERAAAAAGGADVRCRTTCWRIEVLLATRQAVESGLRSASAPALRRRSDADAALHAAVVDALRSNDACRA